jgi:hypothetical protein
MIRRLPPLLALLLAGCTTWTQAQLDLTTQARRGVALAIEHTSGQQQTRDQLAALRRQRLDDAFDADVRDRAADDALTADWVIEHRAAYGAALDAYARHERAADAAAATASDNLAATDAALERLAWLQSIQFNWGQPRETKP